MIRKNNKVSALQIAKILKINERTVQRMIEKFKSSGLLERVGPDRGGYWKIKN